jgi:hypothetical protein
VNKLTKEKLREMIREQLQEIEVDDETASKIDEYGDLITRMEQITAELKDLKKKASTIQSEINPTLKLLESFKDEAIKTNKYLVELQHRGYERVNKSHKKGFELGLSKVNEKTKRILNEALKATETITKVDAKYNIKSLEELSLKDVVNYIKNKFNNLKSMVADWNKDNKQLAQLAQKLS